MNAPKERDSKNKHSRNDIFAYLYKTAQIKRKFQCLFHAFVQNCTEREPRDIIRKALSFLVKSRICQF